MQATPIAEDGHNRRSAACGRVALLRNRATPDRGAVARLFCKSRNCHDCGPRRAARHHHTYRDLLTTWWTAQSAPVLYAFEVAPEAWSSLSKRLRRHFAAYARIPIAAGADLVITDHSTEHDVRQITTLDELASTLEAAFDWHPGYAGDRRRPSHRGFDAEVDKPAKRQTDESAGQSHDAPGPTGWELLGFAGKGITLHEAMRIADSLELEPEPMPERKLAADWAEAFQLRLPDQHSKTYWLLVERLRLQAPDARNRHRRRAGRLDLGAAA
jgi:hypothetical protein